MQYHAYELAHAWIAPMRAAAQGEPLHALGQRGVVRCLAARFVQQARRDPCTGVRIEQHAAPHPAHAPADGPRVREQRRL